MFCRGGNACWLRWEVGLCPKAVVGLWDEYGFVVGGWYAWLWCCVIVFTNIVKWELLVCWSLVGLVDSLFHSWWLTLVLGAVLSLRVLSP